MGRFERTRIATMTALAGLALCLACNAVLSLSDYSVRPAPQGGQGDASAGQGDGPLPFEGAAANLDASPSESSAYALAADAFGVDGVGPIDAAAAGCQATPGACFACAPVLPVEFLNACSDAACVPFDDTRVTRLLLDGGVPPIPQGDGALQ